MKYCFNLMVCIILASGIFASNVEARNRPFADVKENHWAYQEITEAYERGILKGTGYQSGGFQFSPNGLLTKAQFLTVLTRAFYKYELAELGKTQGKWYEPAYKISQQFNLIEPNVTLTDLETEVTRREMAMVLYRLLSDYKADLLPKDKYLSYEDKIPDWNTLNSEEEKMAVADMFQKGILKGIDDTGAFAADKVFSRAEMAIIYSRLNKLLFAEQKIRISQFHEKQVIRIVNEERKKNGLSPLVWDPVLSEAALTRAAEVLKVFEHIRPDGRPISTVLTDSYDYPYFSLGENIAVGFFKSNRVMDAWMNSPGHRGNILDPDLTHIGVGFYEGGWAQLFSIPR